MPGKAAGHHPLVLRDPGKAKIGLIAGNGTDSVSWPSLNWPSVAPSAVDSGIRAAYPH